MESRTAITVNRPRDEIERLWSSSPYRPENVEDLGVTFKDAPGARGTEIHVEILKEPKGGRVGEIVQKVASVAPLARVKDDLRRFKQHVETGEIARSEGTPEGESAGRKFKQRPAQPLSEDELQEVRV